MHRYQNFLHNSGVTHYDIQPTSIRVRFVNGEIYVYDYHVPGRRDVEAMKKLAVRGKGLSTYISQHVGARFASKQAELCKRNGASGIMLVLPSRGGACSLRRGVFDRRPECTISCDDSRVQRVVVRATPP